MVRITKITRRSTTRSTTIIKVDGRLTSADISELEKVCQAETFPFSLDLSDLLSTDADGSKALKRLADAGTKLTHIPPYIKLLLDRAPS